MSCLGACALGGVCPGLRPLYLWGNQLRPRKWSQPGDRSVFRANWRQRHRLQCPASPGPAPSQPALPHATALTWGRQHSDHSVFVLPELAATLCSLPPGQAGDICVFRLWQLSGCEVAPLLPGWKNSKGVTLSQGLCPKFIDHAQVTLLSVPPVHP